MSIFNQIYSCGMERNIFDSVTAAVNARAMTFQFVMTVRVGVEDGPYKRAVA